MANRETIFSQLSSALTKIVKLLCSNEELGRYLRYMDQEPLSDKFPAPKRDELFDHNIRFRPLIRLDELHEAFIIAAWTYGSVGYNTDFGTAMLSIDIFCPIDAWAMNDVCQRPFRIMDIIMRELNNKRLTGIGQLKWEAFELKILTDEYSQHKLTFSIDTNNSNESTV